MSKVRVYEVARELGMQNRELIQRIAALGIQVRNHMSVLEVTDVERLKRALEKDRAEETVTEKIRPTVVRRRVKKSKKKPEPVEAAPVPQPVAAPPAVPPAVPPAAPPTSGPSVVEPVAPAPLAATAEPSEAEPAPRPRPEPTVADGSEAHDPARTAASVRTEPTRGVESPEEFPAPDSPQPAPETQSVETQPVAAEPAATESVEPQPEPAHVEPMAHAEPSERKKPGPAMPAPQPEPPARPKSVPPPVEERLGSAHLPPGVRQRGRHSAAPGPARRQLTPEERAKIVADHQASRPAPRRQIRNKGSIGPSGRPQGRPSRRKLPAGKKPKQTEITVAAAHKRRISIEDQIQLQNLSQKMGTRATDVLMRLMKMGLSGVHINSTLDADTAAIIAEEFGYEVENVAKTTEEMVEDARGEFADDAGDRVMRPPVVTIMGHVDHGKTSLLDKIRSAKVADGEAGGITQHISSFRVETERGPVVFLDTPGHAAFTQMRARGANSTDVVVLVTAADDGVMPQTREALDHSRAAQVPIIVAVNKIDKPDANADRVMNELGSLGLTPEDWGGDTMYVKTSAISGEGIDQLLEGIILQSELLELTANPNIPAEGVVLEAKLDRGRGVVANVLVQDGTVATGDYVVAGSAWGRVRALTDDRGRKLKEAGPATPVELLGLDSLPEAGEKIYKVTNARKAQEIAESNTSVSPQGVGRGGPMTLDGLQEMIQRGEHHTLELVVKADVQGSVEALQGSLLDLTTDKVEVKIIRSAVGGITESDVMLSASSESAIIIGFNVRPQGKASAVAKSEGVEIRTYSVIYEAIDDVKAAMAGLLAPRLVEKELGKAEVRETFQVPKVGTVAGCMVTDGKVQRAAQCRLVRDGIVVWTGKLSSLRRFKEDVRDVAQGFECGIGLENYNDIKVSDVLECFELEEVAATLD